ncbi:MAG: hypothetical protein U9R19_08070, partial [Bacteroidota bacterium]|nr:hypothetical protein [Bacteroidota bacterium]
MEEIIEEYPYFQTVHLLYLKNLHEIGHLKFNKQLRISSSYVANREILYEFLHPGGEKKLSLLNDKIYPEKTKPELINDIDEAKPVKTELEDRTSERKTSKEKEKKQDDDIRQRLSNELLKKIDISPKHLLDFAEFDNTEILQRPFSLDESNEDIIPEKKSDEPTVPIAIETESYHSFNDWLKLISENKLEKHHEKKITEEFTANDRAKMKNQS